MSFMDMELIWIGLLIFQVDYYLWNHPDTTIAGAIEMSANAKSGPAYAPSGEALAEVARDVEASGVTLDCDANNPSLDCLRDRKSVV